MTDTESNYIPASPSTDLNAARVNIVSNQSTDRPSCVISLAEIVDSACVSYSNRIFIFVSNRISIF